MSGLIDVRTTGGSPQGGATKEIFRLTGSQGCRLCREGRMIIMYPLITGHDIDHHITVKSIFI